MTPLIMSVDCFKPPCDLCVAAHPTCLPKEFRQKPFLHSEDSNVASLHHLSVGWCRDFLWKTAVTFSADLNLHEAFSVSIIHLSRSAIGQHVTLIFSFTVLLCSFNPATSFLAQAVSPSLYFIFRLLPLFLSILPSLVRRCGWKCRKSRFVWSDGGTTYDNISNSVGCCEEIARCDLKDDISLASSVIYVIGDPATHTHTHTHTGYTSRQTIH